MAKNIAALYNDVNDSSALEQRFYLVAEGVKGVLTPPLNNSYFYTQSGGSIAFTQPINSSPHRSGRHNNNTIVEKKSTEWSFQTFFNIDTTALTGAAAIDLPTKLLFKSLLGKETLSSNAVYDSSVTPSSYFSLFEVGDKWAKQSRGGWVNSGKLSFPGDGQAMVDWSGNAFDSVLVGISKSVTPNITNTVTVAPSEAKRFPVGSMVMIIKSNGTTRSADTPVGSPRTVTGVAGNIVTLSGANLTDADGSVNPVYLCYYEPPAPAAIDNPLVGLVGDFVADRLPLGYCLRKLEIDINNNHEIVNYCFGNDGIEGFVPGGRLEVAVSADLNLSADLVEFYNDVQSFLPNNWQITLGDSAGRRLQVNLPKIIFQIPAISVPETGSIPVTFSGVAYQTVLDAADEVTVSFL
jgi:hypothetical protein